MTSCPSDQQSASRAIRQAWQARQSRPQVYPAPSSQITSRHGSLLSTACSLQPAASPQLGPKHWAHTHTRTPPPLTAPLQPHPDPGHPAPAPPCRAPVPPYRRATVHTRACSHSPLTTGYSFNQHHPSARDSSSHPFVFPTHTRIVSANSHTRTPTHTYTHRPSPSQPSAAIVIPSIAVVPRFPPGSTARHQYSILQLPAACSVQAQVGHVLLTRTPPSVRAQFYHISTTLSCPFCPNIAHHHNSSSCLPTSLTPRPTCRTATLIASLHAMPPAISAGEENWYVALPPPFPFTSTGFPAFRAVPLKRTLCPDVELAFYARTHC